MRKIGWPSATACVIAAAALSAGIDARPTFTPAMQPADAAACRSDLPFDAGCGAGTGEATDDSVFGPGWADLAASTPDAGPGFQDAASDAGTPLLPTQDGTAVRPPITALFALGGLLILLRKRPG